MTPRLAKPERPEKWNKPTALPAGAPVVLQARSPLPVEP
jgi:hypothetical protein